MKSDAKLKETNEYLDKLIEFEKKVFRNRLIEVKFHGEVQENVIYENIQVKFEHDILVSILKMHESKLENKEINEKLNPLLQSMDKKLKELYVKGKHFKECYKNIKEIGEENLETFANDYYNFIKTKYIMLKRPASDELIDDYDKIRQAFLSFDLNMHKLIKDYKYVCNLNEEMKKEDYSNFIKLKLNALNKELVEISKYDENFDELEEALKDDMLTAQKESEIRDENYKITKENQQLEKEVKKFAKDEIDYEWFNKSK